MAENLPEGVQVKLARAVYHADDLKQRLRVALKLGPDAFIREEDGEPSKLVYRIRHVPEIDPQWRAIVGDCLTNLRAALDHLAWQLVILDEQEPVSKGKKKTSFPILWKRKKDDAGKELLPDITPGLRSQAIREALDRIQPYTRDPFEEHFVWIINSLVNMDKHRLLLVMVSALDWEEMGWSVPDDVHVTASVSFQPLEDGDPVAWFDFHGTIPPVDFNPNVTLTVRIDEPIASQLGQGDAARGLAALAGQLGVTLSLEFGALFA